MVAEACEGLEGKNEKHRRDEENKNEKDGGNEEDEGQEKEKKAFPQHYNGL